MYCRFPLKDKKGVIIVNAFQKILNNSKRKPNKIWVDQGSEFYNNVFKKWLKDNNIEMYSTYNEGKSVVAGRFIRTSKNKIYKHVTAILKNVYFDVLDDIVDEYNNTYHRTIKIKPIDVGDDSFAEYNVSSFASKTNVASLKTEVDKLDIDKLKVVPTDLSKLSNVVKNDVVKKTEYNKLVGKVDNMVTTNFVLKTKYGKDRQKNI